MSSKTLPPTKPLFDDVDASALRDVETLTDDAAEKVTFETVDFSDPNRPKVCLEVDFPILRVNEISAIETNATKPIYMMSKWWARRRSSVFRQLLISSATKAPKAAQAAAQLSWSLMYRKSHQRQGRFKGIKVVDIFMGGGTTVVEAARLGFDVTGIDLNPIAWWVVRNETHPVPPEKLNAFAKYIEDEVKPQIMPFFTARSPRGFDGKWIDKQTGRQAKINPIDVSPVERKNYEWRGPEVIYTFWMKHIMCSDPSCCHLTPQTNSSIFAEKSLKLKAWQNCVCESCGGVFDLEASDFRMAPRASLRLSGGQSEFASITKSGEAKCPHCQATLSKDFVAEFCGRKGRPTSKEVTHYLALPKSWLIGISAPSKTAFGGYPGASEEQDRAWYQARSNGLELLEFRGEPPQDFLHSNFAQKKGKDDDAEVSSGNLICGGCGRLQDPQTSIKLSGHIACQFPFMVQGFDPSAKDKKYPYGGRFFDKADVGLILGARSELTKRSELQARIPRDEIPIGCETHQRKNLPAHGYTHWHKMFNDRQLYVHALLLKTISEAPESIASNDIRSQALGALQNYLRHNCMFTIWDRGYDKLAPHFSNNNYHPKATPVENGVFSDLGRGNFASCIANAAEGLQYAREPYDLRVSREGESGKSTREPSNDGIPPNAVRLLCQSSTNLSQHIPDSSVDLVITDPPFGDNLNYSELADFFLVWLQKPLARIFPDTMQSVESPKRLEAVANRVRHPGRLENGVYNSDAEYDRLLTMCWREAHRILKPGGLLAFTFHHDKDVAWIGVLNSLFSAGFYIESAFPIRSDSTKGKGKGAFGSKKIEFDIVHVCRKRLAVPQEVYWATLRKRITESVNAKKVLLEQHHKAGLGKADLEVMIRGEVLEQYSKHYGAVKKNLAGDLMTVQEILIAAGEIARQLLVGEKTERLPDSASPATSVYFSLFRDGPTIEFNQAKMRLKGSGISLEELEAFGWLEVVREDGQKFAKLMPAEKRWASLARKKTLNTDLDQVHFALNCFMGKSSTNDDRPDLDTWVKANFESLFPSVVPLLKFIKGNHFGKPYSLQIDPAIRAIEKGIASAKAGYSGPKGLFD